MFLNWDALVQFLARRALRSECGVSLVEVTVAVAMAGLFISALTLMSSNILRLLRTAKDDVSASQTLQERVEEMRIASWGQITDAAYPANTLLSTAPDSTGGVANPVETVTVTAYRSTGADPTIRARVSLQNNSALIITSNSNLKDERMVRVDIDLSWKGYREAAAAACHDCAHGQEGSPNEAALSKGACAFTLVELMIALPSARWPLPPSLRERSPCSGVSSRLRISRSPNRSGAAQRLYALDLRRA